MSAKPLLMDGFDNCVLGEVGGAAINNLDIAEGVLVYSQKLIIEQLMTEQMSEEDAFEHFYYNMHGAYMGPGTPVFVMDAEWSGVDEWHTQKGG